MQKHWICPYCNEDILVTVAERVAHENQCQLNCKYRYERRSMKGFPSLTREREEEEEEGKILHCSVNEHSSRFSFFSLLFKSSSMFIEKIIYFYHL